MSTKSKTQIAMEYGVNIKTLSRWLEQADLHIPRGAITPFNQRMIYQKLGKPTGTK
jgi:abortive infection bacteriophage resistance protein